MLSSILKPLVIRFDNIKKVLFTFTYYNFVEPVQLNGEGEYNLFDPKETTVTDSFLGMDENTRGCQDEKAFNCSTQKHIDAFLDKCGCLPLNMKLSDKVCV